MSPFELLNLRRVMQLAAAVAAVAVAAGVVVVAAAYGVFALARTWLTAAGASAVVVAVFALVAVVVASLAARPVTPPKKTPAQAAEDAPLVERVVQMARERPLVALGAAAAAAVVLIRNPAIVTAIVTAFVAGKPNPPPK